MLRWRSGMETSWCAGFSRFSRVSLPPFPLCRASHVIMPCSESIGPKNVMLFGSYKMQMAKFATGSLETSKRSLLLDLVRQQSYQVAAFHILDAKIVCRRFSLRECHWLSYHRTPLLVHQRHLRVSESDHWPAFRTSHRPRF